MIIELEASIPSGIDPCEGHAAAATARGQHPLGGCAPAAEAPSSQATGRVLPKSQVFAMSPGFAGI